MIDECQIGCETPKKNRPERENQIDELTVTQPPPSIDDDISPNRQHLAQYIPAPSPLPQVCCIVVRLHDNGLTGAIHEDVVANLLWFSERLLSLAKPFRGTIYALEISETMSQLR